MYMCVHKQNAHRIRKHNFPAAVSKFLQGAKVWEALTQINPLKAVQRIIILFDSKQSLSSFMKINTTSMYVKFQFREFPLKLLYMNASLIISSF